MNKCTVKPLHKIFHLKHLSGFTLIELVVTIIILSILSATIVPRLFTSNGFEEYAYRTEIISTFRAVQLRAMQQTQSDECHSIKINPDGKALGLLTKDNSVDHCDENTNFNSDTTTSVIIDAEHSVTIVGSDFSFDQMGRPLGCGTCQFTITGQEALIVKIEAEGYIHAL